MKSKSNQKPGVSSNDHTQKNDQGNRERQNKNSGNSQNKSGKTRMSEGGGGQSEPEVNPPSHPSEKKSTTMKNQGL
ncbi:MAG: hypothetical protein C5B52_19580 [Bacteroidetes bacterium]|nr:MAG: hypothetical protein C5B52_19580 [Bacteroidota bacterium]